jgi:hypothetical protein
MVLSADEYVDGCNFFIDGPQCREFIRSSNSAGPILNENIAYVERL